MFPESAQPTPIKRESSAEINAAPMAVAVADTTELEKKEVEISEEESSDEDDSSSSKSDDKDQKDWLLGEYVKVNRTKSQYKC